MTTEWELLVRSGMVGPLGGKIRAILISYILNERMSTRSTFLESKTAVKRHVLYTTSGRNGKRMYECMAGSVLELNGGATVANGQAFLGTFHQACQPSQAPHHVSIHPLENWICTANACPILVVLCFRMASLQTYQNRYNQRIRQKKKGTILDTFNRL